jgi:streptogramin lyase
MNVMTKWAVVPMVLALLGLAGCEGDAEGEDAPAATGPRQLEVAQSWRYAGEPDFLLEGFGSVWALKADGYLLRLDPASGDLQSTIDSGYHSLPACNGDGITDTALWICSGPNHLARIDPDTGVVTRVRARKRADQGRLSYSAGLLWYIESGSTDLVGLDDSGTEAARVPLGKVCVNTTADDSTIWVLCSTDGVVLKVDASSASVVESVEVLNPRQSALGEDLFVGAGAGMVQLDPDSLEVLHTYDVGPGLNGGVDATADEVWVRQEEGRFLTALDPSTHYVIATLDLPEYPGGGDVLITDDWIWAASYNDNVVLRVAR